VLIAMVGHLFSNLMTATVKPLFSPAYQRTYWLLVVAVECVVALGLLIATRGRLGLRPTNERAPDPGLR
jgi:putative copper export protein